jgi:hypothetical protein
VCRSLSAPVHSAKSMRTTTSGLTQMHDFIFSAVNPCPHRPGSFSGRFTNGHLAAFIPFSLANTSRRVAGNESGPDAAGKHKVFLSIESDDQCIEGITGRIATDDELLAEIDPIFAPQSATLAGLVRGYRPAWQRRPPARAP